MNNFIIEHDFLVLNKSIKETTKEDEKGNKRKYGTISLYRKETDEYQKIMIFDKYDEILNKYEPMRTYKIKLQVTIVTKDGKSNTYIKFV